MRKLWMGAVAAAGLLSACMPASAETSIADAKGNKIVAPDGAQGVPNLVLGDEITISCDAVAAFADASDVRVVLTIAEGESPTGYKKVLATEERLSPGAVHIKVPRAPDLANHTVDLAVYVVHAGHRSDCDGGRYRIVDTGIAEKPKG